MNNYFLPKNYVVNSENVTLDTVSNDIYWTENRLKASYHYQYSVYETLSEYIRDNEECVILDIGCGPATKLLSIKNKYPKVQIFGIDQVEVIKFCEKKYPWGFWYVDDFENPTLKKEMIPNVDLIICSDVIEHLKDPDSLLSYIKIFANSNTTVIISTPERDRLRGKECLYSPNPVHIREWSFRELELYIESRKFKIFDHKLLFPVKIAFSKFFLFEIILRIITLKNPRYNQMIICKVIK